jgi:hypothetical protein
MLPNKYSVFCYTEIIFVKQKNKSISILKTTIRLVDVMNSLFPDFNCNDELIELVLLALLYGLITVDANCNEALHHWL